MERGDPVQQRRRGSLQPLGKRHARRGSLNSGLRHTQSRRGRGRGRAMRLPLPNGRPCSRKPRSHCCINIRRARREFAPVLTLKSHVCMIKWTECWTPAVSLCPDHRTRRQCVMPSYPRRRSSRGGRERFGAIVESDSGASWSMSVEACGMPRPRARADAHFRLTSTS